MTRAYIPSRYFLPNYDRTPDQNVLPFDNGRELASQPFPSERRTRFVYHERTSNFIIQPEHKIIFDWVRHGSGNGLIEAVAGAGKTGTLIEVLGRIEGQIFFGVYGRNAMYDIQRKAETARLTGYNIQIATMHGAGLGAWKSRHEHANVDGDKVNKIIELKFGKNYPAETFIRHMVSYGKQMLAGVDFALNNFDRWKAIMLHFGADEYWPEGKPFDQGFEDTINVFQTSLDTCKDVIDHDDMLYAPIAGNGNFRKKDWVLGDEWQDANPARQRLIQCMLNTRGRALFVGDRNQGIFGWTGALADAMDVVKRDMNCHEMKLTTTWRCSQAVTEYAQQWVPELRCRPEAPKGCVRPVIFQAGSICPKCRGAKDKISGIELPVICKDCGSTGLTKPDPWFVQDRLTKDDFVLCRYNRPLIKTAYDLIRSGQPCKMMGRDIGSRLIQLATRWKLNTIEQLSARLTTYLFAQVKRAREQGSQAKELEVTDRVDTLRVFMEQCLENGQTMIGDLVRAINDVFVEEVKDMVTLATPYKAKGSERMRVFWLETEIRQSNLKAWELEQEKHAKYVTATRARLDLILVPEHVHQMEAR